MRLFSIKPFTVACILIVFIADHSFSRVLDLAAAVVLGWEQPS
jgi:hypothetical protein